MTCMSGSWGNVWSAAHWEVALHTGVATGVLAVLLSFTPVERMYRNRYGAALMVAFLTVLGDSFTHRATLGWINLESFSTGATAGLLAFSGSFVLEDRCRRPRQAWKRVFG